MWGRKGSFLERVQGKSLSLLSPQIKVQRMKFNNQNQVDSRGVLLCVGDHVWGDFDNMRCHGTVTQVFGNGGCEVDWEVGAEAAPKVTGAFNLTKSPVTKPLVRGEFKR